MKSIPSFNPNVFKNIDQISILGAGGEGSIMEGAFKTLPVAIKTVLHKEGKEKKKNILINFKKKQDQRKRKESGNEPDHETHDHNDHSNELKLMEILNHNKIPLLYGVTNNEHGCQSIIMERIYGTTIDQLNDSIDDVTDLLRLKICLDLCDVIYYVHSNNIIHRDLKPNNAMIDKFFRLKLLDFGISSLTENEIKTTQRTGTYRYFPPEYCPSQDDITDELVITITQKSDIWALGLIIHEIFSEEAPWDFYLHSFYNPIQIIALLMSHSPFTISDKITNPHIRGIVEGCTEYENCDRYSNTQVYFQLYVALYTELQNNKSSLTEFMKRKDFSSKASKCYYIISRTLFFNGYSESFIQFSA